MKIEDRTTLRLEINGQHDEARKRARLAMRANPLTPLGTRLAAALALAIIVGAIWYGAL